jgi:N-acyl-L-homoserine lactone synthetase
MIRVITSGNIAGNAHYVAAFAALRHRVFVERLGWDVGSSANVKGFEYDRFDTSDAIYIVVCSADDDVIAGVRLLKTTQPFVLSDCFPGLAEEAIPVSEKIWEVTRFVVDPAAARHLGAHVLNTQLVWALQCYGLMAGFSSFVSVSYAGMERILRSLGCRFRRLGSPRTIEGRRVVALTFEIGEDILGCVEERLCAGGAQVAAAAHLARQVRQNGRFPLPGQVIRQAPRLDYAAASQ